MIQQNTSWPGRMRQAARWGPRRAAFGERASSPHTARPRSSALIRERRQSDPGQLDAGRNSRPTPPRPGNHLHSPHLASQALTHPTQRTGSHDNTKDSRPRQRR
jgi:hypothetical protein